MTENTKLITALTTKYSSIIDYFTANLSDELNTKLNVSMFKYDREQYPKSVDVFLQELSNLSVLGEDDTIEDLYINVLALALSRFPLYMKEIDEETQKVIDSLKEDEQKPEM